MPNPARFMACLVRTVAGRRVIRAWGHTQAMSPRRGTESQIADRCSVDARQHPLIVHAGPNLAMLPSAQHRRVECRRAKTVLFVQFDYLVDYSGARPPIGKPPGFERADLGQLPQYRGHGPRHWPPLCLATPPRTNT